MRTMTGPLHYLFLDRIALALRGFLPAPRAISALLFLQAPPFCKVPVAASPADALLW